ncbi:ATP-binding protein [Kitasatospora sp. LaBMicrA B282]|uniref:ATP-binding protein n=1 Tax=Kitasatospora sp. LaBMicrA B282 TaxID=3420949 RepID=UPI003D0A82C7
MAENLDRSPAPNESDQRWLPRSQRSPRLARRLLRDFLLIWVEDASAAVPRMRNTTEGEAGRGLLLVDKLSKDWGWGPREGIGKRVWSCIEPGTVGG